jgi:hypothetical protein
MGIVCSIFWQSPGFKAQTTKLVVISGNSHLGAISQCEQRVIAILQTVVTPSPPPLIRRRLAIAEVGYFPL